MATSRFDNLDEKRQEMILEAAADEFAAKGYEGASINQIIERAGISKGSMYYYFEDKADLFDTTVRRISEDLLEMVGGFDVEKMGPDNFWAYLDAYTERSLEQLQNYRKYMRLARDFQRIFDPTNPESPGSETMEWGREILHEVIERGQRFGKIRSDLPNDVLVQLFLAVDTTFDRWVLERWEESSKEELEAHYQKRTQMLRSLLSPPSAEGDE
ncbi:MAG: TetR/AcrR family transcriptional regulator [Persicimonas sp.]